MHSAIAPTALALALAACSPADSGSSPEQSDLDALPYLTLEEVTRIGSVDDPDYGFSRIGGVDVDRDGNVWVFEAQARELRAYSPTGELLRRVGQRGDGPGEFSQWGTIDFGVAGDTLWVFDSGNRRLTLFNRMGEVLSDGTIEQFRIPSHVPQALLTISPAHLGSDGLFVGDRRVLFQLEFDPTAHPVDTIRLPRVRFDADGEVVDTAGWYPLVRDDAEIEIVDVGQSRYLVPRPPPTGPLLVLLADGYVVVERTVPAAEATLRLTRFTHAGDTVRSREFTYRPKPFPQAVLDTAITRHIGVAPNVMYGTPAGGVMIPQLPQDSAAARARLEREISFPELQPPVSDRYVVSSDGALWLEREDLDTGSRTWTVFNAEDRPMGLVDIPRGTLVRWTDGREVWAVELDELSIPWLVRYRLGSG